MTGLRAGVTIDPWLRPPLTEEDVIVTRDLPATLYRGARFGLGNLRIGGDIFARPATVTASYGEHGVLWQMLIRAEDNGETIYFTLKHMPLVGPDFDEIKHSWFGSNTDGWLCIVGERLAGKHRIEGEFADMFGGVSARMRAEEEAEAMAKAIERGRIPRSALR